MTKFEGLIRDCVLLQNLTLEGIGRAKLHARKLTARRDLQPVGLPHSSWTMKACEIIEAELACYLTNVVRPPDLGLSWWDRLLVIWACGVREESRCTAGRGERLGVSCDGWLDRSAAAYDYLMLHDAQKFSLHTVAPDAGRQSKSSDAHFFCRGKVLIDVASRGGQLANSHAASFSGIESEAQLTPPLDSLLRSGHLGVVCLSCIKSLKIKLFLILP